MSDSPFIISPTGVIAEVNWNAAPQAVIGSNIDRGNPIHVSQPLPNVFLEARTACVLPFTAIPAQRGTLKADVVLGAAGGSANFIAALTGTSSPIAFGVDGSNRPFAEINPFSGSSVMAFTGSGAALPAGIPLVFVLTWDAGLGTFVFTVNGKVPTGSFPLVPTGSWTPGYYNLFSVADATAVGAGAGFNGTIYKVQYGL